MGNKLAGYNNLINEGKDDGFIPGEAAREEALEMELKAMRAAWTLEVTKARRAAWNAEMVEARKARRTVILHQTEQKMGFRLADLTAAILRHKL